MQHVAFFRNLNLGRAHCPTRVQLEQAFLDAGAQGIVALIQGFVFGGTAADVGAVILADIQGEGAVLKEE